MALPTNIRLGWAGLRRTNTSLLRTFVNYACKKFHITVPCFIFQAWRLLISGYPFSLADEAGKSARKCFQVRYSALISSSVLNILSTKVGHTYAWMAILEEADSDKLSSLFRYGINHPSKRCYSTGVKRGGTTQVGHSLAYGHSGRGW